MADRKRAKKGVLISAAGIAANICLAAAKLAVGIVTGLVSVVADGLNNLGDCGSGTISLISFKVSEKPADEEHPYGHGRAESVATMMISFFILLLGAETLRESLEKVISAEVAVCTNIVFITLGVSIALKLALALIYGISSKRLHSEALKAACIDSASDCLSTLAVIAGGIIGLYTDAPADGWTGLAVGIFIILQGGKLAFDASSELLGRAPDRELISKLGKLILRDGVLGVHDVKIYGYGNGVYFATAHAEMDAEMDAIASHSILDEIEHEAQTTLGVALTLHLDPVDLKDGEGIAAQRRVAELTKGLVEGLDLHDFRLVQGKNKKLIFEAGVPFSCPLKDEEIKAEIEKKVREAGDYVPVVTVEREL